MRARTPIAALTLSAAGLVALVMHEGYTDKAVQPLPGDKWTQGFGSTEREDGSPVKPGDRTTPPQALRRALADIETRERSLRRCIHVELYQHEYDVYVDFAYNVGVSRFCASTMAAKINARDYAGACAEFDRWYVFQGRDCRDPANRCRGLVERRGKQRAGCEGRG
jgi:lysozyme